MALTRKMLKAMGIEDEKVDQIIEAHSESVDALKQERDQYKADAEQLPAAQKKADGLQKQLDEIQKAQEDADGKDPWKVKYQALKEDFDKFKSETNAAKEKAEKTKAVREFLKGLGIAEKRLDAVVRVTDIDAIEVEDGRVKDEGGKLAAALKEEWSDFIAKESDKSETPENPPKGDGAGKLDKKAIMEIKDPAERQKAIAENHELFGF